MAASEALLHQAFSQLIAQWHPFSDYIGYTECEDGFILGYRFNGEDKYMAVDTNLNVINDETLGATRTVGLAAIALGVLDALFGVDNQQRY